MATDGRIQMLVLEEFRLHDGDSHDTVARIVAGSRRGREPSLPLLTSIEDRRNVAMLRGLHNGESPEPDAEQHAALDEFVSSWEAPKHYGPRITERSQSPPTHYRLAVTESGINETAPVDTAPVTTSAAGLRQDATSTDVGLLWIGHPVGTFAGLMVLLGNHGDADTPRPDPRDWPLPLSGYLGVRIYEGSG